MDHIDLHSSYKPIVNTDDQCHKASFPLRGLYIMGHYLILPVCGYMDFTVQLWSMWQRANASLEGKIVKETTVELQYLYWKGEALHPLQKCWGCGSFYLIEHPLVKTKYVWCLSDFLHVFILLSSQEYLTLFANEMCNIVNTRWKWVQCHSVSLIEEHTSTNDKADYLH